MADAAKAPGVKAVVGLGCRPAMALDIDRLLTAMDQFDAAEQERTDRFGSQLRQLDFRYLQSEQVRNKAERERDDSFRESQSERDDIFNKLQLDRYNFYDQAETDRTKTFDTNHRCRSIGFEASLAEHERVFQESLDTFSTKHQWYLQTIKSLLSTNQPQRKSGCEHVIGVMSLEFSAFLQAEQDAFQANHERRSLLFKSRPPQNRSVSICA